MPSCAICKKPVTTGIVLCGHCAKGLAPYTLPTDLAWFIDQLSGGDRTGQSYLRLRHVCDAYLQQPGQRHDLPQRRQGVASHKGKAVLSCQGSVTEIHHERKHLIAAPDKVSFPRGV